MPELRLKRIKRISTANRYLQECLIIEFSELKIELTPGNIESEFTPLPKHIDLDAVFVVKEYRKLRNDHTFSHGNMFYLIESPVRHSIAKQKIKIRSNYEAGFMAYFAGCELAVSDVHEPTKPSMFDMDIQEKLDVLELA